MINPRFATRPFVLYVRQQSVDPPCPKPSAIREPVPPRLPCERKSRGIFLSADTGFSVPYKVLFLARFDKAGVTVTVTERGFISHGKILGGGMVGTHASDMIGEIAHGSCTDVPPARK